MARPLHVVIRELARHSMLHGHADEAPAKRAHEPSAGKGHEAREAGYIASATTKSRVPPSPTRFARQSRSRAPSSTEGHLRTRLLLASASKHTMQVGADSEVSSGILDPKIGEKSGSRRAQFEKAPPDGMAGPCDLGVSAKERPAASTTNLGVFGTMKSIELFAGAGGLGMGVGRAGFQPKAVIEWDRWACDTIRENQRRNVELVTHWPLTEGDVQKFCFRVFEDSIDLVSGGPPCQPFSLGGKHRGHMDSRDMFPEAVRAVREMRPRAFLFENVKGLMRTAFADYFHYIQLQLRFPEQVARQGESWREHVTRLDRHASTVRSGLRYNVVHRVLNAANYGVPQRRERVFIVGFRSDLGIDWSPPKQTHSESVLHWQQWSTGEYWERHRISKRRRSELGLVRPRNLGLPLEFRHNPWQTVRDALSDLPDPELDPRRASDVADHRYIPGARSYPGHTGSPLDEPAKTLKAGDHGVPGGENMLRRPDGTIRYFSVRESARLQTFPDEYVFHGSWTESMRQLGNAVPVALAEVVAKSIRRQLEGASLELQRSAA